MADGHIEGLLKSLDATFDAALARQEDEAASDLARSFQQGKPLLEALNDLATVVARGPDATRSPIARIGRDYVITATTPAHILRLSECLFVDAKDAGDGTDGNIEHAPDTFVEVVRTVGRARRTVRVVTPYGPLEGLLTRAATDHVAISGTAADFLVPMSLVRSVQLDLERG